jgi:(1->4)-alpha-D-glucan 1-alpha-D-glucosylmutase
MRIPASTYRFQVTEAFPLPAVAALTDYLRELGADWVYLSPILMAVTGSTHGYDVVDHSRVDPARGGTLGLAELSAAARDSGFGVLVDIVPNHMGVAVPAENAWWWDVLANGQASTKALHFDIDWAAGAGRVKIPVLREADAEAAEADGHLEVRGGELLYRGTRYPLAEGTGHPGSAAAVHSRQHYELIHWERGHAELNYRRFFAISDLAAIRVEVPEVFDEAHVEVARWFREDLVDGLRVDHPDGLADPEGYLRRLAEITGGAYVLVEKILERGEELPDFWPVAGTTGYETLAEFDRLLVEPRGRVLLDRLDADLRPTADAWADIVHDSKLAVASTILAAEVARLARDVRSETATEIAEGELTSAIAELLACFPVYRSYLPYGAEYLREATESARRRRPDLEPALSFVAGLLGDPHRAVARRFQQTSGMVMAKGVEDNAFYRRSPLASLNEVGGDPVEFAIAPADFHRRQQSRLEVSPQSMTTLTTHDTKRGEDTRARISAISEIPEEWVAFLSRRREQLSLGDGPLENLLWESFVGAWPRDRAALHDYAEKAAREAGTSTTWDHPNHVFETRMHALVDSLFDDRDTATDINAMVGRLSRAGWSNGLTLKLLQLTAPGVPDVYQGSELWEHSLVDPDNRRPIDFAERRRLLARIEAGWLPPVDTSGAAKLLVTSRALRARRDRPELFLAYTPLLVVDDAGEHAVAVDRGGALVIGTRLPIGLAAGGGWRGAFVDAPAGRYRDVISGAVVRGGRVSLARLLERYPVALLLPEAS